MTGAWSCCLTLRMAKCQANTALSLTLTPYRFSFLIEKHQAKESIVFHEYAIILLRMPPHYCPEGTEKAPCASVAERVSYQSMVPVWQRESDSPVYGATSHWWQAGGCIMFPREILPLELSQRKKNRKITVCICNPLEPPPALTGKTSAFDVVMKKCPAERSGV